MPSRLSACVIILSFATQTGVSQSSRKSNEVVVPKGTALKFILLKSLDSAQAKVGDDVPIELARPVTVDGITLLQPGFIAHGRITKVKHAGEKCRPGNLEWKVDTIPFADLSSAQTEKVEEVERPDYEPPDRFPSQAIRRGRHDLWRIAALSPLIAPLVAVEYPILFIVMSGEGGKCSGIGQNHIIPAQTIVVVAISKTHRVHY